MENLDEVFEELEDPRTGNAKRHLLHEILIIALCAVLCGGETAPTWRCLAAQSVSSCSNC